MKFCPVEGSVAWYKNPYQESTEAPVVGSDLNFINNLKFYWLPPETRMNLFAYFIHIYTGCIKLV
jgi:hypothetical protein